MARTRGGKSRKSKSSVTVDFSGVETFKKMDEGDHLLKVTEASLEDGNAGEYIKLVLENEDGAKVWHNASLAKQSLWNTKAILEALGVDVPDSEMDIDLEDLVDREMMASIELETYEGKKKPRIVDFWPADGEKGGKDDKDEGSDFDEMDEDDLAKFIKKNKLDVDPDDYPNVKKLRKAVAEAHGEAGESKSNKKGGKKDKPTEDEVDDMSEDELADVIKDHKLDVDLDDFKTMTKKRNAVKAALED